MRRLVFVLVLLALLVGLALPVGAQSPILVSLPPGIAGQAQPLLMAMMEHMQEMGMPPEHMETMMADMQALADTLPPGIFLQLLKLMPRLTMEEMMAFHTAIQAGLIQQPPGVILAFVQDLAR